MLVALIAGGGFTTAATVGTGIRPLDALATDVTEQAGVADELDTATRALVGTATPKTTPVPETPRDTATPAGSEAGPRSHIVEQHIHREVNERRQQHGLPNLSYSSELAAVAEYHSEDMATQGYYSHTSPSGETRQDRYDRFGISCGGGENIAKSYWKTPLVGDRYYDTEAELADSFVDQWMNSSGHRENILRQRFSKEGIGIETARDPDGNIAVYATQNFC